jgi:predicted secreted protein
VPAQDEPAAKEASNPTEMWEHRQEVVNTMRKRIAAIATCVAAMATPVAAQGSPTSIVPEHHPGYEKRYIELRQKLVNQVGLREAGRNIVRDGYREKDGETHEATKAEVLASVERMEASLNPPEPVTEGTSTTTTESAANTSYSGTSSASSSTVQCESGGDYSAVNPAGYYGAYQFDQGTWDAYAPSGYQGVNPAEAPPAVQAAAAASVPSDAWPNC